MPEISVKYTDLKDRAEKVREQETRGLQMLYDNFDDPNWKHGDPQVGTMTFTDEIPPPTPEQIVAQKRELARGKAIAAIKANAPNSPWGVILYDLAVAQGLIEPE